MPEPVILAALRTPIGRRNGRLSTMHPADLLGGLLADMLKRTNVDPHEVDDVIGGCVTQSGAQGSNITRNAWIAGGLPWQVPATTVDRQCGSAQQAMHFAAAGVSAGHYDLVIACGVEHMSMVPLGSNAQSGGFPFSEAWMAAVDNQLLTQFHAAQEIARRWGVSREEMDRLALQSHQRAVRATDEGRFRDEILPVEVRGVDGVVDIVSTDEGIRRDTSLEKLAALPPVLPDTPDITAGNSSQTSDGAAAILIGSREKAEQLGLRPRARFVGFSVAACDPIVMLQGPIPATQKILKRTGMSIDDFDVLECNEAMGSIVPMWAREFGVDMNKVNVNGSGISLGHPAGASGVRMTITMLHELERTRQRYGFQTMCEGGGQGNATIIERLD